MIGQNNNQMQIDMFKATLFEQLNDKHPLYSLAHTFPWQIVEKEFRHLYSHTGQPAHPIRLMTGLTILQRIHKLSDEKVVAMWEENPYFQFFCGATAFQHRQPCAPSDMTHFRNRIGQKGAQFLFKLSISLHGDKINKAKRLIVDTTVQEKNITYPTDAKLYRRVINQCNKVAKKVGVTLRQSYKFVVKKLTYALRSTRLFKKTIKKLRTIAGRQVRDLQRKLSKRKHLLNYKPLLERMHRAVNQGRRDKNKLYSLHAPEVSCIAKGKAHKAYEFGSKMSVASVSGSNVVVSMENFRGNPHDGKTLSKALESVHANCGKAFEEVLVDRGYVGHGVKGKTKVLLPGSGKRGSQSGSRRSRSGLRSSIEALISHLKHGHGLSRNYLKGEIGDVMNGLLSGLGWNMKLLISELE